MNIPYSHQAIDEEDIREVVKVLRSEWLTQGPKIAEFEKMLCRYTGARYAVCVSSGTAALHIAFLTAGVERGDEVITSALTFVASANCALYCGAKPVFADVRGDTLDLDPRAFSKKITSKTRAVIPVHFAGLPCRMDEIKKAAGRGITIIEDACHALGAVYKGKRVGSCAHSDMAVLSFHPLKSITTAEGGAVLTNDNRLYKKLMMLRSHGVTRDKAALRRRPHGEWYYEMQHLGFNYRMNDIQAALGVSQLKKLSGFMRRRQEIAAFYDREFSENPYFELPVKEEGSLSANHLYYIRLKDGFRRFRGGIFSALRSRGIGAQVHYMPVYQHPYYRGLKGIKGACRNAEDYYSRAISIPIYPAMKSSQAEYVAKNLLGILGRYGKK